MSTYVMLGVLALGFGQRFLRAEAKLRKAARRLAALGRSLMPRRKRARAAAALLLTASGSLHG